MAGRGLCIDSVKKLYALATDIAHTAYGAPPPYPVFFSSGHLGDRPEPHLSIAGLTDEQKRAPGGFERHVHLSVCTKDYDHENYFFTLYVLFHEWFCHVYCGVSISSNTSWRSDAFSEGWMDWLGAQILCNALSSHSRVAQLKLAAREFQAHTVRLSTLRRASKRRGSSKAAATATTGESAAARLQELFVSHFADRLDGSAHFVSFSVGLNASNAPDELREGLVLGCNVLFSHAVRPEDTARLAPRHLLNFLDRYVATAKWHPIDLAREIVNISKV